MSLVPELELDSLALRRQRFPRTIAARTKRVYDVVSGVYPLSTYFFHSRAHRVALEMSGIRDGMRVLEVATGSGEMFRRLVRANGRGETVGVDLSPRMASKTLLQVRRDFGDARAHCHAVDARYLPFRDRSFDAIVCCYLLELLSSEDIPLALAEFFRVLRRTGSVTLVCIGENADFFNSLYEVAGTVAPAFWGRQVDHRVPRFLEASGFELGEQHTVRQSGYPSRIITARRPD